MEIAVDVACHSSSHEIRSSIIDSALFLTFSEVCVHVSNIVFAVRNTSTSDSGYPSSQWRGERVPGLPPGG